MSSPDTTMRISNARLLPLLFSFLPSTQDYSADSGRWSEALLRLRNEHEHDYPGLFDDVGFSVKPGRRPYSPEVSRFLTELQLGAVVEVMNPGYAKLRFKDEAQQAIRQHHVSRVGDRVRKVIEKLARELSQYEELHVRQPPA